MEKKIVFLGAFLLIIHSIATFYSWYWLFPWLDIPMHFLGGAFVAMIFVWLFRKLQGTLDHPLKFLILTILLLGFVALIGVLWEFFEFVCDLLVSSKGWRFLANQGTGDMISDLFFDLLGGLAIVLLIRCGIKICARNE